MKGTFITFEGCDGVGKTTQINALRKYLENNGVDVLLVREPGGVEISEKIRNLILDNANSDMVPECELLLYFASRAQLIEQLIKPALMRGTTVICDRFIDSSIAYQGFARNLGADYVTKLIELVCGNVMPDATVFIDLPPQNAFRKKGSAKEDRIESEGLEFQTKVYNGFVKARELYPERFISVKPYSDKQTTLSAVIDALKAKGLIGR